MLIYIEKDLLENKIAKNILNFYKQKTIIEIDNYKNLFDKNISGITQKSIIIAKVNNSITQAPLNYGHFGNGYFFKNSLNCIYDCSYCYLKGAFKNDIQVYFVNYEDIKSQIKKIDEENSTKPNWFYSSDYSDNLATDNFTNFSLEFIPFFDTLKNSKIEIRTKSINIGNLLKLNPSKNVEIAFSLNPVEVIEKYELKTPALDLRIQAINKLLDAGWLVGIRFLPLVEIENYKEIYKKFLEYVITKINFSKINSIFIGGLLYTSKDYNKILQKMPYLDLLYKLHDSKDGFYREDQKVRDYFYNLFDTLLAGQKCNRCLDE